MNEQIKRLKDMYQNAILMLESVGFIHGPLEGMRQLRDILDEEPERGTSDEEFERWQGAAAQKLGEVYFVGIPGILAPDPLRAHYYFIMSWGCRNSDSYLWMARMYAALGDDYHAAMFFKAAVDKNCDVDNYAASQIEKMRKAGKNVDIELCEMYPELQERDTLAKIYN